MRKPASRPKLAKLNWKKIDRDLSHSNLFLNSVFENIPNMVFVKDAKDLRFVRFNKAGEKLLGIPREKLIGKNDYDFFTPEEANFFTMKDREVLNSGKMYDIPEENIHTKSKGIRILHTKKIPLLGKNGKPQFLLGISEDITERKQLEKEVLNISEREQRRIGQDLHDGLGQHLTGISLLATVLSRKLKQKNISDHKEATQISDLINQAIARTRDLSRLLFPLELDSHGLMAALQELASSTRKLSRIDCQFFCKDPIHLKNKAAETHLYRIAQESLDNALKHSRATKIQIQLNNLNSHYQLLIKDNGIGLSTSNPEYNKRGMGLQIMKHRTVKMGGQIKFYSKHKQGTIISCMIKKPS